MSSRATSSQQSDSETTTTSRQTVTPKSKAAARKPLSLMDLEIPVRPLLTREEEYYRGSRVREALDRLAELLPRHPVGYRRFLARMSEVSHGGTLMFTWLSLRSRIEADLKKATRAFEKTEGAALKVRKKDKITSVLKTYERGIKVLKTYRLDPETLFQWSREVGESEQPLGPLGDLPYFKKLARILRRNVEILERERDNMVLPNLRLVLKEVFRYHPTGMRRSDLFQEGILGLHKAVFRYDSTRGIRFSTYATYWIRQSIRKSLIDKSRMIRVPQAIQEELRKENNSMREEEADRVRRILSETVLFSAGDSDDSDDRFSFDVKDLSPEPHLAHGLHTARIPRAVTEALEGLSTRERDVVQRRFGLGGERPQTLEEIGTQLNLSRERIRQIEREALARMRRFEDLLEVFEDLEVVSSSSRAPSRN